ncbi:MAG: sodium:solute symporter [Deltaproteobacteria bacterium]|jgi:SSS family solute:Na+ symporter|nr:sodium:solute symporter [Deltaproteobacteria bacterium]MDA8299615.1 sodium:solute symporter [Deltaproteobacteria bacterium]
MISSNTVITLLVFAALFLVFVIIGFKAANWRKGDMNILHEWALSGNKIGTFLMWFLVGADIYTAYTFIAVPSGVFAKGSIFFFAVPYVMATFGIAMVVMPSLWKVSKDKGYVTAVDFVKDKFNSKTLAILIALTGIVAELPYIALQIVGMKAVLQVMLLPFGDVKTISETALVVSFVILAVFTYWSGIRGAVLTAVMKDVIILITVIVIIIFVPLAYGGFSHAFAVAGHIGAGKKPPVDYATLPPVLVNAYISLFILSALALYLYPHAINGVLSAKSAKSVRLSTALLPIYGIGLAFLALFGILVYAVPAALKTVGGNGTLVVPALIQSTMPSWFTGFAFLGIFIGGLVPAAIMAISQANLLTRNIIKEFKPDLSGEAETKIAKWSSVIFKFLALGFVFLVPETYSIQLQLLGGILIVQTLPPIFIGLYTKWLDKNALIAGWLVGTVSGIYFVLRANAGHPIVTTFMKTPYGLLYVALVALILNLVVTILWSIIAGAFKKPAIS